MDYLDEALRIGVRLHGSMQERQGRVQWTIRAYQSGTGRTARVPAPLTIYQGLAGIGLFLAELGAATDDSAFLTTATRVLRQAGEDCRRRSFEPGLYGGTIGVAVALARLQVLTEDHSELIRSVLDVDGEADDAADSFATDVISGRAGSILGALYVDSVLGCEPAVLRAIKWGHQLLTLGREGPFGMSWPSMRAGTVRDLCGYGHGAAGIGHALGELWARTGERRFRVAAERAVSFEDSALDQERGAWPDHRHMPALTAAEGARDLVSRVPGFRFSYMNAWCHGAPGIGMARIRLSRLIGERAFQRSARVALDRSMETVGESGKDWSLCHGVGGNATACLDIAAALDDTVAEASIGPLIQPAIVRFGGDTQEWPCGTLGRVDDPSLMLGTAGVGLAMLRLAGLDALPILCVPASIKAVGTLDYRSEDSIRHVLRTSFPRTAKSVSDQGVVRLCEELRPEGEADPTLVRRVLDHLTARASEWDRAEREALAADRHAILARLRPQDRMETMKRAGASSDSDCYVRRDDLRLFPEPGGAVWTAAIPVAGTVVEYRCGLVESAVLQALARPMSLDELCSEMSTRLDTAGYAQSMPARLRTRVRRTLTKMRNARLVEASEPGSQLASVVRRLRERVEIDDSDRSEVDLVVEWLKYSVWHSYDLLIASKRAGDCGLEAQVLHMIAGVANRLARVGLWRWFAAELDAATSSSTSDSDRLHALDRIVEGLREIFQEPAGLVTVGETRWSAEAAGESTRDGAGVKSLAGTS